MKSRIALLSALILCASCKKIGDVRTVDVSGDAQGTPAAPASVQFTLTAGELHVTPGGAHTVGGSVRSNVKDLDPKVDAAADHVRVNQGASGLDGAQFGSELVADWRLTMGPSPVSLIVDAGAAKTQLELGGLAIKTAKVTSTTGAVDMSFAQANPLAADEIDVDSGSGAITLTGAGAFGASKIHAHSGVGAITIDLGNKVDREVMVDVEATQGAVTIKVPANVTARALATQASNQIMATGWIKDGDTLSLGGPTPNPKVTIKAKSGGATITLVATP